MNILVLTQILPYPPDAGPRVKTWHVLRYLSQRGHHVFLATFIRPEEEAFLPQVEQVCEKVYPVPMRRSRLADSFFLLKSLATGRPFLIERDGLAGMRAAVDKIVAGNTIDVIHADQIGMAQFAFPQRAGRRPPRTLFDSHNAVWQVVERMSDNANPLLRLLFRFEARKMKTYETGLLRRFDRTMTVTRIDKESYARSLRAAAARRPQSGSPEMDIEKITPIPIAVDTSVLQPGLHPDGSLNILTLGTLHYPPNADGIRWFFREAYPLVRKQVNGVTLTIVGKNPPQDFLEAARRDPSIEVTGYAPDLQPHVDAAALMVVPVRAGGGMRVRILEAFARGMPVVTTTVGLEGIEARHGEDLLVADTAQDFASCVVRLLEEPELGRKLSLNARRLAVEEYDWQVVLGKMDAVYEALKP